jgi:hypothetical protein
MTDDGWDNWKPFSSLMRPQSSSYIERLFGEMGDICPCLTIYVHGFQGWTSSASPISRSVWTDESESIQTCSGTPIQFNVQFAASEQEAEPQGDWIEEDAKLYTNPVLGSLKSYQKRDVTR